MADLLWVRYYGIRFCKGPCTRPKPALNPKPKWNGGGSPGLKVTGLVAKASAYTVLNY